MSAGHKHGPGGDLPKYLKRYFTGQLIMAGQAMVIDARVDDTYDNPWLAGRSINGKTLYFDRHMPHWIKVKGLRGGEVEVDVYHTVGLHELTEWELQNAGLEYLPAHRVATECERESVEHGYRGVWADYEATLDDFIKGAEREKVQRCPRDLDLRPFKSDKAVLATVRRAMA